jgi:hypothetical protein
VPFTLAHAAAAVPFRRTRLVPSALVVGTFAPDFEYFLTLGPQTGFGHTLLGVLVFTIPLALVVLWLFHRFVKVPLASALPASIEMRLIPYLGRFPFSGPSRFALIVISVVLGIATHLAWDSLTHSNMWLYQHWSFLRGSSYVPVVGALQTTTLLQHVSTIVGLGVLMLWSWRWYQRAPVSDRPPARRHSTKWKIAAVTLVCVAVIAGLSRGIAIVGIPGSRRALQDFAGEAVVTTVALVWWQLVIIGMIFRRSVFSRRKLGSGD